DGGQGVHLRSRAPVNRSVSTLHALDAPASLYLSSEPVTRFPPYENRVGWGTRFQTSLSKPSSNLTIATTGASGAIFLRQLLLAVDRDDRVKTVNFIASDSALRVMAEELELRGRNNLVGQLLGRKASSSSKIRQQANADIGANVASGSYPADAMIVLPCSVG